VFEWAAGRQGGSPLACQGVGRGVDVTCWQESLWELRCLLCRLLGHRGLAAKRAELRAEEIYSSAGGRPADSATAVLGRVKDQKISM